MLYAGHYYSLDQSSLPLKLCLTSYKLPTSSYYLLLKRMQLTSTARVGCLKIPCDRQGKAYKLCQKHALLSLHNFLPTGRHLLGVSFIIGLKSNLCTALTTWNSTWSNCIILRGRGMTVLQPNVFLTGIHWLFVIKKKGSAFPTANYCQGQLKTSQSLSILRAYYEKTSDP
jgi:hypothetical protein